DDELDYKRGRYSRQILNDFITKGYPFAQLHWEEIRQDSKNRIHARLKIDPGPFIVNDTVVILNPIKTKRHFIQQSVHLELGKPFNENSYQNIGNKLQQLDFLELAAPPDIAFSGGRATAYLRLKEEESSSFEGIIGLLPNQTSNGGMLVTGYLDLDLGNLFYSGKQLQLNWQQFAAQSQQLSVGYSHPYLFGSDVMVGGSFNLIKQDTTFITRDIKIEVGTFLFGKSLRFDGAYSRSSGSLITPNIERVSSQTFADYSIDYYSTRLSRQVRTNTFSNYWAFDVESTIGKKTIENNAALPASYYDTLNTVSTVYRLKAKLNWQQILLGQTALFLEYSMGLLENTQILRNELYRVGGLRSLRGFNENFFFSQNYFLSRLELRQYFEQRSFLFLFYDQMIFQAFDQWSTPLGLGTGLSLNTNNGLFSFAFALGSSKEIPFDINNTKIHLGYTSRF
ncbi:MAG: hypothetical protein KI791_13210, partial [Cyclobacteriaceae bacterium]|nr:hypothetical protein [Cyclobacteriaceae bacterium SS2]